MRRAGREGTVAASGAARYAASGAEGYRAAELSLERRAVLFRVNRLGSVTTRPAVEIDVGVTRFVAIIARADLDEAYELRGAIDQMVPIG